MQELTLPKSGQAMENGIVHEWHVAEGDAVSEGDAVVTVETDKTTSDVVADRDGTLLRRAVAEGETVPVGTVLGYVGDEGADPPEADGDARTDDAATEADGDEGTASGSDDETTTTDERDDTGASTDPSLGASPTARRIARERGVDLAAVREAFDIDQIRPPHIAEYVEEYADRDQADERVDRDHTNERTATDPSGNRTHREAERDKPSDDSGERAVLASPLATRIASENDADIDAVGHHVGRERVRKADVDAYLRSREATEAESLESDSVAERGRDGVASVGTAGVETGSWSDDGPTVAATEPIVGARKVMFDRMSQVAREYADTTTVARVDVTRLWDRYERLSETWSAMYDVDPSVTAFVVKAVAECLPEAPPLNAELTDGESLTLYEDVNVGVAVSTDDGTLVPPIRDADERTVRELSREIDRLAGAARDGDLTAEDLQGGTFTVSNAGALGAYMNTPQIVPPQTAILGVCTVFDQPGVIDGEVVPRKMLHLCLTYDHRVVHGDTAVGFLQDVKALLEEPDALLS